MAEVENAATGASASPADGGPVPFLNVGQKEFIERSKLTEHAERFEDMASVVRTYITAPETRAELTADERNLFSIAYKNVIGIKRSAWRIVKAIEDNVLSNNTGGPDDIQRKQQIAREYRQKISGELVGVANEVIELLDNFLLPRTQDNEAKVFFLKMKADYLRYLAEVTSNVEQAEATEKAHVVYAEAIELAKAQMASTHPIRLGLVLNYSVFYYEIMQNKEEAQQLAKMAFDSAISELDILSEESYKDSTMVLQLIRDNLTLWTNEAATATDGEAEESELEEIEATDASATEGEAAVNTVEGPAAVPDSAS